MRVCSTTASKFEVDCWRERWPETRIATHDDSQFTTLHWCQNLPESSNSPWLRAIFVGRRASAVHSNCQWAAVAHNISPKPQHFPYWQDTFRKKIELRWQLVNFDTLNYSYYCANTWTVKRNIQNGVQEECGLLGRSEREPKITIFHTNQHSNKVAYWTNHCCWSVCRFVELAAVFERLKME